MQSRNDIGFGKKIRACWLESALDQAAAGMAFDQAKHVLAKEIAAENPGPEAIRKIQTFSARTILQPCGCS
jgi:hypothetical protein